METTTAAGNRAAKVWRLVTYLDAVDRGIPLTVEQARNLDDLTWSNLAA